MEWKWGKEKVGVGSLAQIMQAKIDGRPKSGRSGNHQYNLWHKTMVDVDKRAQSSMGKALESKVYPRMQQSRSYKIAGGSRGLPHMESS